MWICTRDLGAGWGCGAQPHPNGCSLLPRFLLPDNAGALGRVSYTSGRARADQSGTAEGVPGVASGSLGEGIPSAVPDRLPDRPLVYETRPRMRRGASFHTRRGWAFALDKIASTMIEASPIESVGPFHRTKEKRPSALTTLRVAVVPVLGGARVPRLSLADQPGSSLALTGAGDLGGSSWLVAGMKRPV
jgi:hypothetical protein